MSIAASVRVDPTVMQMRFNRLPRLGAGIHRSIHHGCSVMEAVGYVSGVPWSDRPIHTSPVIATFLTHWGDAMTEIDRNRLLKPLVKSLINTAADDQIEMQRMHDIARWMMFTYLPSWITLLKHGYPTLLDPVVEKGYHYESDPLWFLGQWVPLRHAVLAITLPDKPLRWIQSRCIAGQTAGMAALYVIDCLHPTYRDMFWDLLLPIVRAAVSFSEPVYLTTTILRIQDSAVKLIEELISRHHVSHATLPLIYRAAPGDGNIVGCG